MALSFSPMLFSIPMIEQLVGSGDSIATWYNVHESAQLSQFVIFFFDCQQSCIVLFFFFLSEHIIVYFFYLSRLFLVFVAGFREGHGNSHVTCMRALGSTSIGRV